MTRINLKAGIRIYGVPLDRSVKSVNLFNPRSYLLL
jgi:hypothetical protein